VIQKLLIEAQKRLSLISAHQDQYRPLLKHLIVQGLQRLNERQVQIVVRKEDIPLVKGILDDAVAEYVALGGQKVELSLDPVNVLPPGPSEGYKGPTSSGGVILTSHEGKIICKNTLDARLGLAFEQRLPEVRVNLFGRSKTRTHLD